MSAKSLLDIERMLQLFSRDSSPSACLAATLGVLLQVFAMRSETANRELDWFLTRMYRAFELDQTRIYFDRFGRYCGHGVWTCIPDELERRMLEIGAHEWPAEDFHAAGNVWVLQFSALHGSLLNVLLELRRHIPSDAESVSYFRYKRGGVSCKRVSRRNLWAIHGPPEAEPSINIEWLLFGEESEEFRHNASALLDSAIQMGMAAMLLGKLAEYSALPLAALFSRIRNPIQRRQYRLYTSTAGAPIAFYTWAWMESEDLRRHGARPVYALELGDWNEGSELFLCDAVATEEGVDRLLEDLRGGLYSRDRLFVYPCCGSDRDQELRVFHENLRGGLMAEPRGGAGGARDVARAILGRKYD